MEYRYSYRISIPAADLETALSPSIWPLRVKAREFVHYSSKPKNSGNMRQFGPDNSKSASQNRQLRQLGDTSGSLPVNVEIPTFSRFDPLRDRALSLPGDK